jgi:hypothetical protein
MVQADKTKLIQHLQILHADWLADMSTKLDIGKCVNTLHDKNMQIHFMLKTIYRFPADEDLDAEEERCLTCAQLDDIICRLISLLKDCNC